MNTQVLQEVKSQKNRHIVMRYPCEGDAEAICHYINTLSKERTFVRFQGEQISLKEQRENLSLLLKRIARQEAILLLVFASEELIGMADIQMQENTKKHVGALSISIARHYRGKGIGSLLMTRLLDEATKNLCGLEIITLAVFSTNSLGKQMYKRFGFIEYGLLPHGIKFENGYADRVLMYKPIKTHHQLS